MAQLPLSSVSLWGFGLGTCCGRTLGLSVDDDVVGLKGTTCATSGDVSGDGELNVAINEDIFY